MPPELSAGTPEQAARRRKYKRHVARQSLFWAVAISKFGSMTKFAEEADVDCSVGYGAAAGLPTTLRSRRKIEAALGAPLELLVMPIRDVFDAIAAQRQPKRRRAKSA